MNFAHIIDDPYVHTVFDPDEAPAEDHQTYGVWWRICDGKKGPKVQVIVRSDTNPPDDPCWEPDDHVFTEPAEADLHAEELYRRLAG